MEGTTIAKKDKTNTAEISDITDTANGENSDISDSERPELPENMEEMGGPTGGGFPGQMTGTMTNTNEWLVPMTCTGIISGVIVVATAVVCFMIYKFKKK